MYDLILIECIIIDENGGIDKFNYVDEENIRRI